MRTLSTPGQAALELASSGRRVFPCHTPAGAGCSCRRPDCASPAKHPRTRHGLRDATSDLEQVRRWWRRWPDANLGLCTGAGLVVLDVDPAHGGFESLAALQRDLGALPATRTVRTGSGGLHLYFEHPGELRNSTGALGPGLDVRADGGYVIAPPSRHVAGADYRLEDATPIAPLPRRLLERMAPPPPARRHLDPAVLRPAGNASAWAAGALSAEAARVAAAPVGQRNHTLNRAAFVLGQIVAGGHLDEAEVVEVLARAGEASGLGVGEVTATVASGLGAGRQSPRHPAPPPQHQATGRAPETPVSIERFVEQCERRLWTPAGAGARDWLTGGFGFGADILRLNRIGADPGAHIQSRPPGAPSRGTSAVLPVLDGQRRAVSARLRPLHPSAAGRELALAASGHDPALALAQPVDVAGPCVVVAEDLLSALAAAAGGYQAMTLLRSSPLGDNEAHVLAAELASHRAPMALALDCDMAHQVAEDLRRRGLRVARLAVPDDAGLSAWMARSHDWQRELAGGLRTAWSCAHKAARTV